MAGSWPPGRNPQVRLNPVAASLPSLPSVDPNSQSFPQSLCPMWMLAEATDEPSVRHARRSAAVVSRIVERVQDATTVAPPARHGPAILRAIGVTASVGTAAVLG